MTEISVVLRARNASATIGEQLAALHGQRCAPPWELIVVDNGSTDDTPAVVQQWQHHTDLRLISAPQLRSTSFATNAGVHASRANKVLLCDADDVVTPTWVAAMSRVLDEFDLAGGALDYTSLNPGRVVSTRARQQTFELPSWRGVAYGIGASLGFRRDAFDTVGGFDEEFRPVGAEDMDFCIRAHDLGLTIGFAADAVVRYRLRSDLRGFLRQQHNYGAGAERLIAKHPRDAARDSARRRARVVLGRARAMVFQMPALFDAERRWAYLGECAFVAGAASTLARLRASRSSQYVLQCWGSGCLASRR
jgi:glycosyltransferase involved in cell wall biosynthesis